MANSYVHGNVFLRCAAAVVSMSTVPLMEFTQAACYHSRLTAGLMIACGERQWQSWLSKLLWKTLQLAALGPGMANLYRCVQFQQLFLLRALRSTRTTL